MQIEKSCVIPICEGRKFSLVHKFPSNTERFIEWKDAIEKNAPIAKLQGKSHTDIRKRYFICCRHFSMNCYKNIESRNLNLTAIPHLNLTNLNDYKKSKAFHLSKTRPSQPTVLNSSVTVLSNIVINPARIESQPKLNERDIQQSTVENKAIRIEAAPQTSKIIENDQEIEVRLREKSYEIDNFWLRDHCRCEICYDHKTFHRKIDILTISDDIMPKAFHVQGEQFLVEWNDEHKSVYDIEFLIKNLTDEVVMTNEKILWTKDVFEAILQNNFHVSMRDYMSDPQVTKIVLRNLHLYGVAFVNEVQPSQQNTEFVIRQLFSIQKTFFGEMWTFTDENHDHADAAYPNNNLRAHSENTYFNDCAGLQVLHCIQNDTCVDGENFLIDGFQVANKLKICNSNVFERLTTTVVETEYIAQGRHHKYAAPIIKLDAITGDVIQIRYNCSNRTPLSTQKVKNVRQFYKDLKILAAEMERDDNRVVFKLQPGTVMIFDNWRILHGWMAFKGQRRITGCFVSRDEYESALRINGFIS